LIERVFLDTNVLLYADDQDAGDKQFRAQSLLVPLIASGAAVISTQVLQEFFVIATRKLGLASEHVRARMENLARLDVVLLRPEIILSAVDLHNRHQLSFWDALIVRAAAIAGCGKLLSEDLQHGQSIDGVLVENPFLGSHP
jgi:predicted nucleic acid-binding protein